jgi:hypothetical protein
VSFEDLKVNKFFGLLKRACDRRAGSINARAITDVSRHPRMTFDNGLSVPPATKAGLDSALDFFPCATRVPMLSVCNEASFK